MEVTMLYSCNYSWRLTIPSCQQVHVADTVVLLLAWPEVTRFSGSFAPQALSNWLWSSLKSTQTKLLLSNSRAPCSTLTVSAFSACRRFICCAVHLIADLVVLDAVYADGGICLDILQNQWSPIYDVSAILTSIQVTVVYLADVVNGFNLPLVGVYMPT